MANDTHHGSCHCGAVQFDVELDLTQPVISCNCSMCARAGTLLAFVAPEQFTLRTGEDALTNYQFHKHVIDHLFCSTCGIKPFARGQKRDGTPMVAVNARCLEDVDVGALNAVPYDGKSS